MTSVISFSIFIAVLCSALGLGSGSAIRAAPYYMPLDNDPQNIDDIVAYSGIKHFIFAFALGTNAGECIPTWDGNKNQLISQDTVVLDMVKKVRSHGGDISISFGGYNGVELGHVCGTPESLAAAYQQVIDKYQLTHVDFDIEGDDLGPADEETKRFQAIKILKQNAAAAGRELHVTLTLPCTTVGLSELGRAEIARGIAVQQNLVDLYKVMAFDYGGPAASMAESVMQIMEMVHAQLKALRTDLSEDQLYAHTGMILMNGHTDQATEMFTLETFQRLVEYANQKKFGRVSYWSLNRDRPCPEGKTLGWVAGICSSIAQQPWEFNKIVAKFNPGLPDPVTQGPVITPPPVTPAPWTEPITTPSPWSDTTATQPQVTPPPATQAPGPIDCAVDHVHEQYYPYNGDCHKYIRCFGGQAHVETCPGGLLYDLTLHICNWEQDVHRPECKQ